MPAEAVDGTTVPPWCGLLTLMSICSNVRLHIVARPPVTGHKDGTKTRPKDCEPRRICVHQAYAYGLQYSVMLPVTIPVRLADAVFDA
jgi:hypothetical protein